MPVRSEYSKFSYLVDQKQCDATYLPVHLPLAVRQSPTISYNRNVVGNMSLKCRRS